MKHKGTETKTVTKIWSQTILNSAFRLQHADISYIVDVHIMY
jgi:hypothetical protein